MGCLEATHMVLSVSVPGLSEPLVGAMSGPSIQMLRLPAALLAPSL